MENVERVGTNVIYILLLMIKAVRYVKLPVPASEAIFQLRQLSNNEKC